MCLQSKVLKRKNITIVIFNKFREISLYQLITYLQIKLNKTSYKYLENHTSANASGKVNEVNQKKIKSSSNEYAKWMYLKF